MSYQRGMAMSSFKIDIGQEFKPDPAYKKAVFLSMIPVIIFIAFFSFVAYWMLSMWSSVGSDFLLSFLPLFAPSASPLIFFVQLYPMFASPLEQYTLEIIIGAIDLFVIILAGLYANAYVNSLTYKLKNSEVEWTRGVIGRYTGVVPYKQITNVDVVQGPVSRMLGIGSIKIQTAGYSGEARAEISIDGIRDFNRVKSLIMKQVKAKKK